MKTNDERKRCLTQIHALEAENVLLLDLALGMQDMIARCALKVPAEFEASLEAALSRVEGQSPDDPMKDSREREAFAKEQNDSEDAKEMLAELLAALKGVLEANGLRDETSIAAIAKAEGRS